MVQNNQDIRREVAIAELRLWQVAYACGFSDSYFSRKLRKELPREEKEKILQIISELRKEGESL